MNLDIVKYGAMLVKFKEGEAPEFTFWNLNKIKNYQIGTIHPLLIRELNKARMQERKKDVKEVEEEKGEFE